MQLASKEFALWCFDHAARIAEIIPLGCSHDGETCCDALDELIFSHTDKELGEFFSAPGLVKHMQSLLDDGDKASESERRGSILEYLIDTDRFGFLVKVQRCVKRKAKHGFVFSWAYCQEHHIYTVDLDAPFVACLQSWIESQE